LYPAGFFYADLNDGKDILQRRGNLFTKLFQNGFHSVFNDYPVLPNAIMNFLSDSFPFRFLGLEKFKGNIPKLLPRSPQFFLRMPVLHFFKMQYFTGAGPFFLSFPGPADLLLSVPVSLIIPFFADNPPRFFDFLKAGSEVS
jgi:hypothetical protein